MEQVYKIDSVELIVQDNVFQQFLLNRQHQRTSFESGGLLLGRTDINGKTRIIEVTEPMDKDIRERMFFMRKDKKHLRYLAEANNRCLYFKGNWHTHPQEIPEPSWLDRSTWRSSIKHTKPGESKYIFFVIVGIGEVSIWCGNMESHSIIKMEQQIEKGEKIEI